MKTTHFLILRALAAAVAFTLVGPLRAADTVRYDSVPGGSKVRLDGTSTFGDWKMEGAIIGGTFEIEKAFQTDLSLKSVPSLNGTGAPTAKVFIPVGSLKSGKETMDNRMKTEMKATEHPRIEFKLTAMKVKGDVPASGTPVKFDTKGDLTIVGVTKPVSMEVTLERLEGNKIKFKTATPVPIKMSDHALPPPEFSILGIGLAKTGDEVKVSFEWTVAIKQAAPQ
jgi:polyisoprenoid-binding protein YceI